jgi:TonB-linked SusC/RagA family outer membrane protein
MELTVLRFFKKLLLIMRLTAILLFATCLQVSAGGFSQTVSFKGKNVALQRVFSAITHQTGYVFFCDYTLLQKTRPVTIDVKGKPLSEVLNDCLKGQSLEFSIEGRMITITPKVVIEKSPDVLVKSVSPPVVVTHGKVTNEKGEPLSGASIKVKGSVKSAVTNEKGEFQLDNLPPDATLVISFIGYETQEIKLKGKNDIDVQLKVSVSELDQVQTIAYGTTTKRVNTGDVSKITSEEIEKQPVSNVLAALEGRVPGVNIAQLTGTPGGAFSIQVRGQNSLRLEGSNPLYIIDGVPFPSTALVSTTVSGTILQGGSPLSNLNPGNIESVDILKDADATAIYGSRGANGVVLITTKTGKTGKTKIEMNLAEGWGKVTRKMDLLNTKDYLRMRREAFSNDQATPDSYNAPDLVLWDTTRYTDWQKLLIGGTAHRTNAQATVSGGTSNTQFLLGGSYLKESTVFPGDLADQKGQANFSIRHINENKKLTIDFSASYVSDINNLNQTDLTSQATSLPPVAPPVYTTDGQINWAASTWPNSQGNPLANLLKKYNGRTDNLIANSNWQYQIAKGLRFTARLGYTNMNIKETVLLPLKSFDPAEGRTTGISIASSSSIKTWIAEPLLEYTAMTKMGKLNFLLGSTFQQDTKDAQEIFASGFSNDELLTDIQAASQIYILKYDHSQYKYNALFGRINYDWQDKYLLNLTARRDGSSRFGPGKQFANFGAVGAGWVFSKEPFTKRILPLISYGKLRASYGITGNDQIPDYGYLASYSPTSYPYNGISGLIPSRLANPDFSWEKTKKTEVALEMSFMQDRIFISAAYYNNRSSNQLVGYPLSLVTGQSSVQYNLPATIANYGWEFELTTINIKNTHFSWSTSFNLTIPINRLIAYPGIEGSSYATVYTVGKSVFTKQLYHFIGIDPQTGIYRFEDKDNDGMISYPNDLFAIKKVASNYYGGLQNSIRFGNFQLEVFFQFVKQTGYNYAAQFNLTGSLSNQPAAAMDRWRAPGDANTFQRLSQDYGSDAATAYYNHQSSDAIISDATFIRLKNMSLSYNFSGKWLERAKLNGLTLYLQGQNLLTITHYAGLDPENQTSQALPPLRMINAGLTVNF